MLQKFYVLVQLLEKQSRRPHRESAALTEGMQGDQGANISDLQNSPWELTKEPTVLLQPHPNVDTFNKMTKTTEEEMGMSACARQTSWSSIITLHFFWLNAKFPDLKRQVYFGDSETQMNAQTKGISGSIRSSFRFKRTKKHTKFSSHFPNQLKKQRLHVLGKQHGTHPAVSGAFTWPVHSDYRSL